MVVVEVEREVVSVAIGAETKSSKSSSKAAANLCWSTALVIRGSDLELRLVGEVLSGLFFGSDCLVLSFDLLT